MAGISTSIYAQDSVGEIEKAEGQRDHGLYAPPSKLRMENSATAVGRLRMKPAHLVGRRRKAPHADSEANSESETKPPLTQVNGYVDNRFQYSYVDPNITPISTIDLPSIQEILEANIQLRVNLSRKFFLFGDISIVYQNSWLFYDRDSSGGRVSYPDHEVAALHGFMVPSELYLKYSPRPWLNFLVGKKRIIWGAGVAFNPTDVLNPPKDPTDPNFQRAGQWLARLELPFEKFTISMLFAPQVLYQNSGVPYAIMKYSDCSVPSCAPPPDDSYHYLLVARLYMLLYNADINLFYYFSNKYENLTDNFSRFGASFSRYFFTEYEFHIEALFQVGSPKVYPDLLCASGGTCNPAMAQLPSKIYDGIIYPRILVGGRTQFKDDSVLSIEYYYQADGYSDSEFEAFMRVLVAMQQVNPPTAAMMPSGGEKGALPQRFTFDPIRRHYLIVSYSKPKIKDDWTVGAVLIAGLSDLSGMIAPSVTWNAREWLNLSLYGFIPIRGIPVGQVTVNDKSYSEYSLLPIDFRLLFEARASY